MKIFLFKDKSRWYFSIDDGHLLISNKNGVTSKSKSILQIIAILSMLKLPPLQKWDKEESKVFKEITWTTKGW